jgi:hypothetical protein
MVAAPPSRRPSLPPSMPPLSSAHSPLPRPPTSESHHPFLHYCGCHGRGPPLPITTSSRSSHSPSAAAVMAAVILSLSHDRLLLPSAVAVTVAAPRTLPPHPPPSSTADRVLLRPFAATLVRRLRLLPGLLSHSRLAVMLLLHVCMTRLLQQLQQAAVGECCRPSAEPPLVVR